MIAQYYIICTTDLVRKNNSPLINDIDKELYSGLNDFFLDAWLRFIGIKKRYPNAEIWFNKEEMSASVFVEGVLVFKKTILSTFGEPMVIADTD